MSLDRSPFEAEFETVLRRHLRLLDAAEPIAPDGDLATAGLDSIETLDLLLDLEESFGISFPPSLLQAATFRTSGALIRAVASLIQ